MIELNKPYVTKDLAKELGISLSTLKNNRVEYEKHLAIFYDYEISKKGNATCYTFIEQRNEYIPYKEFKRNQKNKTIVSHIHTTISYDPRQTGSNIARIIIVDNEIQVLNYQLSTLKVYVREELKKLVEQGYYDKTDYKWCYLDKKNNSYVEMTPEEVKHLREYFHTKDTDARIEDLYAMNQEGEITKNEYNEAVGTLHKINFVRGCNLYKAETGNWPIKVPIYVRRAFLRD